MTSLNDTPPGETDLILPAHIEQTVQAIGRLHAEHHRGATPWQRTVDRLTRFLGRPRFALMLAVFILGWLSLNLVVLVAHGRTFDPPPFDGLQGLGTMVALFVTVFILITQRRNDQLSELREQLTLELAMLSEQKAAKLIELMEELRRDLPNVINRVDGEADALARPADPEAVLEALKENQIDPADAVPATVLEEDDG
jgi:uncharacterized membrane protein